MINLQALLLYKSASQKMCFNSLIFSLRSSMKHQIHLTRIFGTPIVWLINFRMTVMSDQHDRRLWRNLWRRS
jgi:hypothetical protein